MAGLVLTRLGHAVIILEQNPSSNRQESGAGITMGLKALDFFEKYDLIQERHTIPCPGVNYFDMESKVKKVWTRPMQMSSWNSLYYRLRANFDGLESEICSRSPERLSHYGKGTFKLGANVTDISMVEQQSDEVAVKFTDSITGSEETILTDQVIVADGASSSMRQLLLLGSERKYSGYLAWRGLVDESEMDEEARNLLTPSFSAFKYDGGYIMW